MPHAAFYVVQLGMAKVVKKVTSFNAARSIICGATVLDKLIQNFR